MSTGPGTIQFVLHNTQFPQTRWYLGLDLGQRKDHSALTALELTWAPVGRCLVTYSYVFRPRLSIRSLERFPVGTNYEDIHAMVTGQIKHLVQGLMNQPFPTQPSRELIVDAGGPGPPVVDRLRRSIAGSIKVSPVIITGGKGANTLSGGYTGIPRRSLISQLVMMIGAGSLRCTEELAAWGQFKEELLELSGQSTQPASRAAHDDLVLATALAAWAAVRDTPVLLPPSEDANRETWLNSFGKGPLF